MALTAPEAADVIQPLEGLGFEVVPEDGGATFRIRLVFQDDDS